MFVTRTFSPSPVDSGVIVVLQINAVPELVEAHATAGRAFLYRPLKNSVSSVMPDTVFPRTP